MPSKKERAKRNKAPKGPPLYKWQDHLHHHKKATCKHDSPTAPLFSPTTPLDNVNKFMILFEDAVQKKLRDGFSDPPGPAMHVLREMMLPNPPPWWDDRTFQDILAGLFVRMGTDHLLHGESKNFCVAKDLAAVVLTFEAEVAGLDLLAKNRDLKDGDNRELIKFFRKRTTCNCLDDTYARSKAQSKPKMSTCHNCGIRRERSSLKLCGGCRVEQYCGAQCQKAAWPSHKKDCEFLVKREASLQNDPRYDVKCRNSSTC